MKKLFAVVLALALVLSCAAVAEEATEQIANFTIFNLTGETVTELTLTENASGKVTDLLVDFPEGMPADGTFGTGDVAYPADAEAHGFFTLAFKTESGYEGKFETLSIETAPISLLAADAMTGPTMISFKAPNWPCDYEIHNVTGEIVESLTLTDNVTGDVLDVLDGGIMQDGDIINVGVGLPQTEEAHARLTLAFKTASGYEGKFETLSIEVAPIYLLSAEGMTGATMISFRAPEE